MCSQTPIAVQAVDAAISQALAAPCGPAILADMADNPCDGAPSDDPAVLRRLVEHGVADGALGCLCDPLAGPPSQVGIESSCPLGLKRELIDPGLIDLFQKIVAS